MGKYSLGDRNRKLNIYSVKQYCSRSSFTGGILRQIIRKLVHWAGINTRKRLYVTCIRPVLEYACQLWDPYTKCGGKELEDVQKFACKVCLGKWDMPYNEMLAKLDLPKLATRRTMLKLTTMHNIVNNGLRYFYPNRHNLLRSSTAKRFFFFFFKGNRPTVWGKHRLQLHRNLRYSNGIDCLATDNGRPIV